MRKRDIIRKMEREIYLIKKAEAEAKEAAIAKVNAERKALLEKRRKEAEAKEARERMAREKVENRAERILSLIWSINDHIYKYVGNPAKDALVGKWLRWRFVWFDAYYKAPGHDRIYLEDHGI